MSESGATIQMETVRTSKAITPKAYISSALVGVQSVTSGDNPDPPRSRAWVRTG